jgi:hypothetical protein
VSGAKHLGLQISGHAEEFFEKREYRVPDTAQKTRIPKLVKLQVRLGQFVGCQTFSLSVFVYLHLHPGDVIVLVYHPDWNRVPAKLPSRFQSSVTGNKHVIAIDDYRIQESVNLNTFLKRRKITKIFPYTLADRNRLNLDLHRRYAP